MPVKSTPNGAEKGKKSFQEKEKNSESLVSKSTLMGPKSGQHSKTIDLASKSTLMGPNAGWDRILMGRIANANAIPDTNQGFGISDGGGGGTPSTPAQTSIVEIMTQTMEALVTQNNDYIVTQKEA